MTFQNVIIVWLALQLTITSILYCKVLKEAAYNSGKLQAYNELVVSQTVGTCYAKGGC